MAGAGHSTSGPRPGLRRLACTMQARAASRFGTQGPGSTTPEERAGARQAATQAGRQPAGQPWSCAKRRTTRAAPKSAEQQGPQPHSSSLSSFPTSSPKLSFCFLTPGLALAFGEGLRPRPRRMVILGPPSLSSSAALPLFEGSALPVPPAPTPLCLPPPLPAAERSIFVLNVMGPLFSSSTLGASVRKKPLAFCFGASSLWAAPFLPYCPKTRTSSAV
mmetsp:Transcript_115780/g.248783  ORF Transcript_115780/g.248783 Transcript_115780/m.248783 type:complete len:219 (-) Transcript_115780:261-917(-)